MIYKTISGDTFDKIAHKVFGSSVYLPELFKANADLLDVFEFKAGVEINIPVLENKIKIKAPPWKKNLDK